MSKRLTFVPECIPAQRHSAYIAWRSLGLGDTIPDCVEVLKVRDRKKPRKKSMVYRLGGVGHGGAAVIAKRARRATMLIERFVYQEILPALPVASLHCYGFVEEPSEFCWLFLEEAGGVNFCGDRPAHRVLAADWLAAMHGATSRLGLADRLPPIEPQRYLASLRAGRQTIRDNLSNPRLDAEATRVLQKVIEHCDFFEESWDNFEQFCADVPRSLVHSDFIDKNVRVRDDGITRALYPLDWERAGWGVPAEDLAGVDVDCYWQRIRDVWPTLDLERVRELARIGTIFQNLCFVEASSRALCYDWVEHEMADFVVYESVLAETLSATTTV